MDSAARTTYPTTKSFSWPQIASSPSSIAANSAVGSPRRREVRLVDLGMTAKVRPALVISVPAADTDRALATLIPHTTSPRQSQFEAEVAVGFLRAGVFDAQNLITIPHAKLIRQLGKLNEAQLAIVEAAVRYWLGLRG